MKIVHLYAQNLEIFNDALEATGCRVNGSANLDYLIKSLPNYNAREVMGLVVFRQHMTKKTLKLIKAFDELFVFSPLPIIVIADDASELYAHGKLKVRNSPLFLIDSEDGTISDIDLRRIFTTLCCMSDTMYDLSSIETAKQAQYQKVSREKEVKSTLAEEVLQQCALLGGKVQ